MITSHLLHEKAKKIIPGGVSSPVRAFKYVGGTPPIFVSGNGAHIQDIQGKDYIDYVGAYGPMIVGHGNDYVLNNVSNYLSKGTHFGASHELELEMAEKIISYLPYIEKIRFVSSGTEACMSAVRLARAYKGKRKIIKFNGCYHGHSDSLLVSSGSGALSCGQPSSPGVLDEQAKHTLVASYNDLESVKSLLLEFSHDVAAIIVEPIAGNMGMVLPQEGFLAGLRKLCDEFNCLLLFDEVMTGFRVALGGSYELYGVEPDILMLGKVLGGGFPIGAFAAKAKIMDMLAPDGPVYQAGTLSGSPIALAAGSATLDLISAPGFFELLAEKSTRLVSGLKEIAVESNLNFQVCAAGGMFGINFSECLVTSYPIYSDIERQLFISFFHKMLASGINLAPSPYEAAFISSSHSHEDIEATLSIFKDFAGNLCEECCC